MIAIKKGLEPISLTQFRASGGEKFDNLDSSTKNDIRESLLAEQGYLCAYCMGRIGRTRNKEGVPRDVKIEHVVPRAHTAVTPGMEWMEIDYHNLVAVCEGKTNGETHCDTCKGNTLVSLYPGDPALEASIKYSLADGTISSSNEDWNEDINSNKRLNLNHPTLKLNRKAALRGFIESLPKNKDWSKIKLERKLNELNNAPVKEPYLGTLTFLLKKKLAHF